MARTKQTARTDKKVPDVREQKKNTASSTQFPEWFTVKMKNKQRRPELIQSSQMGQNNGVPFLSRRQKRRIREKKKKLERAEAAKKQRATEMPWIITSHLRPGATEESIQGDLQKLECEAKVQKNGNEFRFQPINLSGRNQLMDTFCERNVLFHTWNVPEYRQLQFHMVGFKTQPTEESLTAASQQEQVFFSRIFVVKKRDSNTGGYKPTKTWCIQVPAVYEERLKEVVQMQAGIFEDCRLITPKKMSPFCKRCASWGHIMSGCYRQKKCYKCGADHDYKKCTLSGPPQCINCDGDHPASYGGCSAAPHHQSREKKLASRMGQKSTQENCKIPSTASGSPPGKEPYNQKKPKQQPRKSGRLQLDSPQAFVLSAVKILLQTIDEYFKDKEINNELKNIIEVTHQILDMLN